MEEIKKKLLLLNKSVLVDFCKKFNVDDNGTKDILVNRLIEIKDENGDEINFEELILKNTSENKDIELLRKEIDLLRRENDLLKREKMFELQQSTQFTVRPANYNDYEGMLSEFSATDDEIFSAWHTQIKMIQNKYNLDGHSLRHLIVKKLKGRALEWFRSKPSHIDCSVEELLDDMKKLFDSRMNKLVRRKEFWSRFWRKNEPFTEYFYDKIIKSNELNVDQEELIECIIDGIRDLNLQNIAKSLQFKTTDQFLSAFSELTPNSPESDKFVRINLKKLENGNERNGDTGKNNQRFQETRQFSNQKMTQAAEPKYKPQPNLVQKSNLYRDIRCFNCNSYGHYSSSCPKPKRQRGSCYKCGQMDHTFKECQSQPRRNNSNI